MADTHFTHFDTEGAPRMVNVGGKEVTHRMARASARVEMLSVTLDRIRSGTVSKGDVLGVARLAGIMAAKRTDEFIPLCHSLALDSVEINFRFDGESSLVIESTVHVQSRTGVEMEALIAVTAAGLTVYDMCKSVDRGIRMTSIHLLEKSGGQSGHYRAAEAD